MTEKSSGGSVRSISARLGAPVRDEVQAALE